MSKLGILFCALCFVFCPIGIGMLIVNMVIHFDFGVLMIILSYILLSYLWIYELNENVQLKSKIKDLKNKLDNAKLNIDSAKSNIEEEKNYEKI